MRTDNGRQSSFRIIARDIGALQVLLSAGMVLSLMVSLLYRELYSALAFLTAAAITAACGAVAYRACRNAGDPKSYHAMVIAGAGWFVSAVFGALPFLFIAFMTPAAAAQAFVPAGETYASSLSYFRSPLHALFESMSAYTTTGLTMAVHEPSIGHGLLFYRSLAQWIGGAGVIVLSLAIIPRPGAVGGLELYHSETTGTKLRPSIIGTARAIWKVYAAVTAIVAVYLVIATLIALPRYGLGNTIFDAINHAMTGQSTGGFSTLDDSIAGYRSYAMDLIHIPPMVLGAISLPLFYLFLRDRDPRVFWRDAQFRTMIILFAVFAPALVLLLWRNQGVRDPIREGVFQFISSVSTTGWQTSDIAKWGSPAILAIVFGAMITGGAAGATVGGIKLIRSYLLVRGVGLRIRRAFLPSEAVISVKIGDRCLPAHEMQREVADAAVFSFVYLVILVISVILVAHQLGPKVPLAHVLFECASAQSTVGLSTGITDPGMPIGVELVFIFQMWVGRLEIFPVIILLKTLFLWRRGRAARPQDEAAQEPAVTHKRSAR